MNLPTPKTHMQEVLLCLIENESASIKDFFYMAGFRTRISELNTKYGLYIHHENKIGKNKFGNTYVYASHSLKDSEIEKAKKIYLEICK